MSIIPQLKCTWRWDQDSGGVRCGAHLIPTKTLKIHLQVKGFTQNICWIPAEDLRLQKEQETSINQVGQKEKDKRKEFGWGLALMEGAVKEKGSYSLGSPLHGGEISWTEGELQSLGGELRSWSWKARLRATCREGGIAALWLPRLRCSSVSESESWMLKLRLQEERTGNGWEMAWRGWTVATEGVPLKKTRPAIETKCHWGT